jgi:Ca-activated chloride channel homolog
MNKLRLCRLLSLLLAVTLLLALPGAALANGNSLRGKGFKGVVKHLETNYRAKKMRIPLLGLANFAVKVIRPAGVKGFKLAVFNEQDFSPRAGEPSFVSVMREAYTAEKGWKPLVQVQSKRESQTRAFIFIKENKKDIEVAVTTLSDHEAAVIQVKFSPDKLVQFLDNPRIMGISLGKSLRGQMDTAVTGAMNPKPPAPPSVWPNDSSSQPVVTATVTTGQPVEADAAKVERPVLKDATKAESENEEKTTADTATPASNVVAPKDPNAIRIETRLVNLNVKALNKTGQPLTDLKLEDFELFEDDAKQEIAHFKPVNAPVHLTLLLDLSGSTKPKRKAMIEAAHKFIEALPAQDQMSIAAFTRKYYRLSKFTSDKLALKQAVEKIKGIEGGTAYYDAMSEALIDLSKLGEARKAIVVLTDGEDESLFGRQPTGYSFEQMLNRAAEEDVTIYPIYFRAAVNPYQKLDWMFNGRNLANTQEQSRARIARNQLEQVAEQTGGEVVNAQNESELAAAYQRVATELHMLYSLAYSPDKLKHDGSFRKIAVKVNRDAALAKTRKGYYDK